MPAAAVKKEPASSKSSWNKIKPHVQPIYQTSVFDYPDLDTLDDFYNGLIPEGYLYSRNGLPNSDSLGKLVAQSENCEAGVVCSSGMAALSVAFFSFAKSGDHIVASSDLYGGTTVFLREELSRLGIKTSFVNISRPEDVEIALGIENTKLVLVETISNPAMKVCDIGKISKLAHNAGALLIVDNTMANPFVVKPFELGADIVMHSGTKFLGGHHDITIGVLCGRSNEMKRATQFSSRVGTISGPFDSWLACRSFQTWKLRTERSCENASKLAEYLDERKDVVPKVYFPGLKTDPSHKLASEMFTRGKYGAMLSFDLNSPDKAGSFVKALSSIKLAPSLGGVRTTISHPGKTSHRNISREERNRSGITDAMIRVSVGIEEYESIEADFDRALAEAK